MNKQLTKILVVRNDKLGDFMLSLPSFALLKLALPQASVHALLPDYTREIAQACPFIDAVIHDPGIQAGWAAQRQMRKQIQAQHYDAVLTLFSSSRVGWQLWRAAIPYRLAPATKLAQVFYNHRLVQHRSQSAKPEYVYNVELAKQLLQDFNIPLPADPLPPYLQFENTEIQQLKAHFLQQHGIPTDQALVFIHPGSGGSAVNLALQQYAQLARELQSKMRTTLVISAGPGEIERAQQLGSLLQGVPHVIYHSQQGLTLFAKHIAFADVFISGSTGPLHIAGVLNRATVGFYPRRRSATALRWQTVNSDERHLAFSPPEESAEENMSGIDVIHSANRIYQYLLHQK